MLRKSAMYNLTLHMGNAPGSNPVATNSGLLGVDSSGVTPRTPEILNSLIAMTNPFDSYQPQQQQQQQQQIESQAASGQGTMATRSRTSSGSVCVTPSGTALGQAVPGELNSPTGVRACSSPPSVQHTRSQLIKEGLKLTLQTKRRHVGRPSGTRTASTSAASLSAASLSAASLSAGDASSAQDDDDDDSTSSKRSRKDELTIEDEERRRRRRERNKVAATKCRIKKREKTVNLVQESHVLESQNQELKSQIQELEAQKTRLADMLRSHSTTCPHSAQVQATARHGTPPDHLAVVTTPGEPGYPGYMGYPSASQPLPPCMYSRAASTPSSDTTSYDLMDSPNTFNYDNHGSTMYSPPCRTPSDVTEAPYTRFDLDLKYNRTDILKTEPYTARSTMYYGVTKQEVGEDPLLSGLADGLDSLADPGFNQSDPHFCGSATPCEQFGAEGQSYCCRPTSLPLDTPPSSASLETPGSVCSPANFQYYGSGAPDCSYGLDNGCMA